MDFEAQIEEMIHRIGVQGVMAITLKAMTSSDLLFTNWDDAKEFAKTCLNDCVPEDVEDE